MFSKLFTNSNEGSIDRTPLTDESQIEEIINLSNQKPVLIFKHSTSCGISSMVLKRFENKLNKNEGDFYYYYLDLLQYRNISNYVSKKFHVYHQSPQLLVIKNGEVLHHNSHYGIMDVAF